MKNFVSTFLTMKDKLAKRIEHWHTVASNVTATSVQDVALEDLLGRDPIEVNMEEVSGFITDKVIMVTGGGGSIGSELCRQLAKHHPKQLIVFDIYENNAHAIKLELNIGSPIPFDADEFLRKLQRLTTAAYEGKDDRIRDLVAEIVPTYHPAGRNSL